MVHIPPFRPRRRSSPTPQFAVDCDQVDQRATRPKLSQAELFLATLDFAAEYIAIKPEHCFKVSYAQYDMIYFADPNHRSHYCRKRIEDRGLRIEDSAIHSMDFKEKRQIQLELALWNGAGLQTLRLSPFQGWKSFGADIPVISPAANLRSASGAEELFLGCHRVESAILGLLSSILDLRSSILDYLIHPRTCR